VPGIPSAPARGCRVVHQPWGEQTQPGRRRAHARPGLRPHSRLRGARSPQWWCPLSSLLRGRHLAAGIGGAHGRGRRAPMAGAFRTGAPAFALMLRELSPSALAVFVGPSLRVLALPSSPAILASGFVYQGESNPPPSAGLTGPPSAQIRPAWGARQDANWTSPWMSASRLCH
jgi:hypothetical protein